jgi:hypothetical protein
MAKPLSPTSSVAEPVSAVAHHDLLAAPKHDRRRALLAGGISGNARLTALTGFLLLALFAVQGVTIVFMGQLLWLHFFIGLLLAGPVALKLSSAGYRMVRYYTGAKAYRDEGAPPLIFRGLAPLLVLCTAGLFATGLTLLLLGPSARQPVLLLHKVFFFAWLAVAALHVLGHLPDILHALDRFAPARRLARLLPRSLSGGRPSPRRRPAGATGRSLALVGSVLVGAALAAALTGQFHVWAH